MPERGKQFEEEVAEYLSSVSGYTLYRENYIRKKWGTELSGVDIMLEGIDKLIFIQCKWENDTPTVRDINHFTVTSEKLVEKLEFKSYEAYFISRCPASPAGRQALEDKHAFILIDAAKGDNFPIVINKLSKEINKFLGLNLVPYITKGSADKESILSGLGGIIKEKNTNNIMKKSVNKESIVSGLGGIIKKKEY